MGQIVLQESKEGQNKVNTTDDVIMSSVCGTTCGIGAFTLKMYWKICFLALFFGSLYGQRTDDCNPFEISR